MVFVAPDADVGVQVADSKGRTALHKAAYRGSVDCLRRLLRKGADLAAETVTGVSALSLILKLPNGLKLLNQRFDSLISTSSSDPNDFTSRMTFDYSALFSQNKTKPQMGVIRAILCERPLYKTAPLLQHPLVESFLYLKWRKIRLLFFSTLIAYLLLVVGVTTVSSSSINH